MCSVYKLQSKNSTTEHQADTLTEKRADESESYSFSFSLSLELKIHKRDTHIKRERERLKSWNSPILFNMYRAFGKKLGEWKPRVS